MDLIYVASRATLPIGTFEKCTGGKQPCADGHESLEAVQAPQSRWKVASVIAPSSIALDVASCPTERWALVLGNEVRGFNPKY